MSLTKALGGSGGGGGLADGDYGDIVVSGSGTVLTIDTSVALAGSPTTTTQTAGDNSTKLATTAYVDTAVSGASGIGGWDPDGINASANALDAEFNNDTATAWPAGWSAQGGGDFAVTTFPSAAPGRFSTQPTVAGWRGRYASAPASGTDFILAARVGVVGTGANYSLCGIGLGTTTTQGATSYLAQYCGYHNGLSGWGIGTDTAGAFQKNWGAVQGIATGLTLYIRRVGTNYFSGWSADGLIGVEDTARTYAWTPAYLHIGCYGDRSNDSYAFIKWVRFRSGSGARINWGAWV